VAIQTQVGDDHAAMRSCAIERMEHSVKRPVHAFAGVVFCVCGKMMCVLPNTLKQVRCHRSKVIPPSDLERGSSTLPERLLARECQQGLLDATS
jgi:hypothetical protein